MVIKRVYDHIQRAYNMRLKRLYERVDRPEDLRWHSRTIPDLFYTAINSLKKQGRALDLGCGTGLTSIALARQGYTVTGIDFAPKAIEFARQQAQQAQVSVEFLAADMFNWQPTGVFDVIVDFGCLHGIVGHYRHIYLKLILQWLAAGGDYILLHFGKKHRFDFNPVGPRRVSHRSMIRWLSPWFEEKGYASMRKKEAFPVGPVVSVGLYWFRKRAEAFTQK